MKQTEYFSNGEGDRYFDRNRSNLSDYASSVKPDPVMKTLEGLQESPRRVLEIGTANGWRLACIAERWKSVACSGLDPSVKAIMNGRESYPDLNLQVGTAQSLPFADDSFDLVIFGFCLYLCDREHLFAIASEADRVLQAPGLLAIYDFLPDDACRNIYGHAAGQAEGMYSYKMDYARMFDWNPQYRLSNRKCNQEGRDDGDRREAVSLLHKLPFADAYPPCGAGHSPA